jgi:hypothetical protein
MTIIHLFIKEVLVKYSKTQLNFNNLTFNVKIKIRQDQCELNTNEGLILKNVEVNPFINNKVTASYSKTMTFH